MLPFLTDWLNLLIRWAHLIAGIAWIGTSFYFMALDLSLRKRTTMPDGVMGTAWLVHGGGFYNVEKYGVAPASLPDDLIWFKWEAYLTWMTGFLMLVVQFYLHADLWLIDTSVANLKSWQAIAISIASLFIGWKIYDVICRSPIAKNTPLLAVVVFLLIIAAAYFYTNLFSSRSALVHVGALIGTFMAFNVFAIIIPNQKKITASLLAGQTPNADYGVVGKQRSTHNTYLTLPVLVFMLSGHYPMLTNHPQLWLIVALVVTLGACLRHFLLRHEIHDAFKNYGWTLPVMLIVLGVLIFITRTPMTNSTNTNTISDAQVITITQNHCTSCHAKNPSNPAFREAPKNVVLETVDDLRKHSVLIQQQAVYGNMMPLGSMTNMTQEERQALGAWLQP